MEICNLPNNILEKIFSELNDDEIPSLTLVCKHFNEIISSSLKLMKNFTVRWKKSTAKTTDLRLLLRSQRKYQQIYIEEVTGIKSNLQNFLTKHSKTLTEINFYECSLKSSEFASMLEMVKENLRTLSMCSVNFEVDSTIEPIEFNRLEYMTVMYDSGDGYCRILNLFENFKTLKDLRHENKFEIDIEQTKQFSCFLSSCSGLKTLTIYENVTQKIFLNEDFNNAFKFELKKLFIHMNPHHIVHQQMLQKLHMNIYSISSLNKVQHWTVSLLEHQKLQVTNWSFCSS